MAAREEQQPVSHEDVQGLRDVQQQMHRCKLTTAMKVDRDRVRDLLNRGARVLPVTSK